MSVEEAMSVQMELASQVSCVSAVPETVRYVAGLDLSPPAADGTVRGAAVVLSYPELVVEEVRLAQGRPGFPYIPGLLSFRETPVLLEALKELALTPDIIICDGQGLAHPRRFGIACHIGLLTDRPTIGCAKSILRGKHPLLGRQTGSQAELTDKGEVVGMAVRTRADVSPVYVSIGHKVDLPTAARWVMACCKGKRLLETTVNAHNAAAGRLASRGPSVSPAPEAQQARLL